MAVGVKNALKIDNNTSSLKSEEIPSNFIPNNSDKMENMVHHLVILSVGLYLIASYGLWRHINNTTRKENIFLNTTNNNFLEGTNYNYSCIPIISPQKCKNGLCHPRIENY
jgi:hypothetical protein